MRYYLDVNAIIELSKSIIIKFLDLSNTFISWHCIHEMLKRFRENFDRQKSQFKFIKENIKNYDADTYEDLLCLKPYGFPAVSNKQRVFERFESVINANTKDEYDSVFINHTIDPLARLQLRLQSGLPAELHDFMEEHVSQMGDHLHQSHYKREEKKLRYRVEKFIGKTESQIIRKLKEDHMEIFIYYVEQEKTERRKSENERANYKPAEIKKIKRRWKDKYDGSADTYLKVAAHYYSTMNSAKDVERNDAPDLYHVAYLRKDDDIFVTNDRKLNQLINDVFPGRAINFNEYISRIKLPR